MRKLIVSTFLTLDGVMQALRRTRGEPCYNLSAEWAGAAAAPAAEGVPKPI